MSPTSIHMPKTAACPRCQNGVSQSAQKHNTFQILRQAAFTLHGSNVLCHEICLDCCTRVHEIKMWHLCHTSFDHMASPFKWCIGAALKATNSAFKFIHKGSKNVCLQLIETLVGNVDKCHLTRPESMDAECQRVTDLL